MNLAIITPTKYLDTYSTQGDIYLALAHLIDDNGENEYARFHRREADRGRRVILDNGLFEGAQVEPEVLIQRARAINASCVCAPDVLYDAQGTIKEFKRFIKLKQEEGLVIDVMGIPQATDPVDWWTCFKFFDQSEDCQLIGLSILSIPAAFGKAAGREEDITSSRMYLIAQLFSYKNLLGRGITPCHLLGLGDSYEDIKLVGRLVMDDIVVSNDSSSAFVHGQHGVRYLGSGEIPGGKIKEKLNFELDTLNEDQEKAIQHNIDIAQKIRSKIWF